MKVLESEFSCVTCDEYGVVLLTVFLGDMLRVDEIRYTDTKVQWARSRWVAYFPGT
jgi:hypothetical protein